MAREAVYIRIVLEEMGHKQPSTSLQTDDTTAEAVQRQNTTKINQSDGHEISLVKGQTVPRTIQYYLK